jgi:hypothetical protein
MGNENVETPYGLIKDAVHLEFMANGGPGHQCFKDGIGYVKVWSMHGGSYQEDERILVSFERRGLAKPRRANGS